MKTKLTSFFVLVMLMMYTYTSAAVITHDISMGSLTIPSTSTDEYVITGSTTSNYVVVPFGWKGTITLRNCYFDFTGTDSHSPIRITGKNNLSNLDPSRTNVNIILDGDNYIYNEGGGRACIQVDQGAQINISAVEPCDNTSGTLTAIQANRVGGAAIGSLHHYQNTNETTSYAMISDGYGDCITAGGNIVISSGTITAKGGHGAAVGGGYDTWYDGMIVIHGGIVNASAVSHSAGIGSGCPLGTGLVNAYAPNSAVIALPPASITAIGAYDNNVSAQESALAGTNVRVYIGDPNQPVINVRTAEYTPNANVYVDLSQDPDINRVVSTVVDPDMLDINSVLLGKTDVSGVFSTTGSLMNPTTFYTDASSLSNGSPYLSATKALPSGGEVVLPKLQTQFSIESKPSELLEPGYTALDAKANATVFKITYDDNSPMSNLTFSLASGSSSSFLDPIFLASDSTTVVSAPTTFKKGDVYYIVVPIKTDQAQKVHTDVLMISGIWHGSSTGYIRQVINQIVAKLETVYICEGSSYYFNGVNLTEPGIYTDVSTESTTCATSSTVNAAIRLIVTAPKQSEENITICTSDLPFRWNDTTFNVGTESGSYVRNFVVDGCDSTAILNLTVGETYDIEFTDTICKGQTYRWNTERFTETGSYTRKYTTRYGCDSIVTLHLIVGDLYNIEWYDTICDGETYRWNDQTYTTTGNYTQSFTSRYGCDSIVTLCLTVGKLYNHSIIDTICAGETYSWDGMKYTRSGVYPRKYSSVAGCDSVVTLYLTVGETYDIEFADTICQGETYVWNKIKYTKAGSYSQSFTTQHGCDSNVTVHLFVAPIVYESYAESICQDEPYKFGKRILTTPGVYVDSALSMYGCDSITTLTLRIHEPYLIDQYIEVCHDDTFNFRGKIVSKPGIYYDSLLTQHGCDSVYRLIYNKTPTYLFHSEDTMCVGATYTYRGKKITKAGIYYDSLTTVSGCDSIYRLVLHTHPTYMIYSLETEDICADAPTYEMVVQYDGVLRPSHYNLIYSQEAKSQGFRDVVQAPFVSDTLNLPIPHATPYIRPDYYNVTLQLTNPVCPFVTSEYETQLLVRYPSWIIEQNWQDVVATKNAQYNGGYYFQEYDWYVNNVSAAQANSYLYLPSLQVGDEVVLYATRMGEDYAIPTCPIIIEQQDTYEHEHPVPVYPVRISRADRSITLFAADSNTRYHVYDILGRSLASGMCEQGDDTIVDMPTMSGSYFVMLVDAEENKQVVHFMVE